MPSEGLIRHQLWAGLSTLDRKLMIGKKPAEKLSLHCLELIYFMCVLKGRFTKERNQST